MEPIKPSDGQEANRLIDSVESSTQSDRQAETHSEAVAHTAPLKCPILASWGEICRYRAEGGSERLPSAEGPTSQRDRDRIDKITKASGRLLWTAILSIAILVVLFLTLIAFGRTYVLLGVMMLGALGTVIFQVRRLRKMSDEDIELIIKSNWYTLLGPFTGAALAGTLYLLFISGLLAGSLFPKFEVVSTSVSPDGVNALSDGVNALFITRCSSGADYAKLFFWSFVAGFSEKFVINIIGQLESNSKHP